MSNTPTNQTAVTAQPSPWTIAVAAGAGFMSFLVCRTLFKQSKAASFVQAYVVVTSTLGALKSPPEKGIDGKACLCDKS